MGNLASVQRIIKLEPIIGADLIEKATVLGWEVLMVCGLILYTMLNFFIKHNG